MHKWLNRTPFNSEIRLQDKCILSCIVRIKNVIFYLLFVLIFCQTANNQLCFIFSSSLLHLLLFFFLFFYKKTKFTTTKKQTKKDNNEIGQLRPVHFIGGVKTCLT